MNKLLVFAVILITAVALGGSALAASKKISHRGAIVGVPDSTITLRVSINKGRPTKVSAFRAKGVPTSCDTGDFLFRFESLDPTKVTKKGNFKEALKNTDGSKLTISGRVRNRGRKVIGYLKTNKFDGGPEAGICRTPKTKFVTEKR